MTIKTPWIHDKENYPAKDGIIQDAGLATVCRVARTNQAEHIATILRAVNAHDALVGALRKYVVAVGNTAAYPDRALLMQAYDEARAALALAERQASDA